MISTNKAALIIAATVTLITGCTAVDVSPVSQSHNLTHVCIEENPKVIVAGFVSILESGFERHMISTELYQHRQPADCEFRLEYTALRTWDLAPYLSYAELKLYKGSTRVGYAEYHLRGKGGLSLVKWAGAKSKMDPVIDELLEQYK